MKKIVAILADQPEIFASADAKPINVPYAHGLQALEVEGPDLEPPQIFSMLETDDSDEPGCDDLDLSKVLISLPEFGAIGSFGEDGLVTLTNRELKQALALQQLMENSSDSGSQISGQVSTDKLVTFFTGEGAELRLEAPPESVGTKAFEPVLAEDVTSMVLDAFTEHSVMLSSSQASARVDDPGMTFTQDGSLDVDAMMAMLGGQDMAPRAVGSSIPVLPKKIKLDKGVHAMMSKKCKASAAVLKKVHEPFRDGVFARVLERANQYKDAIERAYGTSSKTKTNTHLGMRNHMVFVEASVAATALAEASNNPSQIVQYLIDAVAFHGLASKYKDVGKHDYAKHVKPFNDMLKALPKHIADVVKDLTDAQIGQFRFPQLRQMKQVESFLDEQNQNTGPVQAVFSKVNEVCNYADLMRVETVEGQSSAQLKSGFIPTAGVNGAFVDASSVFASTVGEETVDGGEMSVKSEIVSNEETLKESLSISGEAEMTIGQVTAGISSSVTFTKTKHSRTVYGILSCSKDVRTVQLTEPSLTKNAKKQLNDPTKAEAFKSKYGDRYVHSQEFADILVAVIEYRIESKNTDLTTDTNLHAAYADVASAKLGVKTNNSSDFSTQSQDMKVFRFGSGWDDLVLPDFTGKTFSEIGTAFTDLANKFIQDQEGETPPTAPATQQRPLVVGLRTFDSLNL